MDEPDEHHFSAKVDQLDFGRMKYAVVYLPKTVQKELANGSRARAIGTVGGVPFRGGVLPAGGGRHYLLLSKRFLKSAGLAVGDPVSISLRADDPDAVELVPEFERALSNNATALQVWERMTPGARRGFAHRVATAKQPATRLARIEECIDELCQMADDE